MDAFKRNIMNCSEVISTSMEAIAVSREVTMEVNSAISAVVKVTVTEVMEIVREEIELAERDN